MSSISMSRTLFSRAALVVLLVVLVTDVTVNAKRSAPPSRAAIQRGGRSAPSARGRKAAPTSRRRAPVDFDDEDEEDEYDDGDFLMDEKEEEFLDDYDAEDYDEEEDDILEDEAEDEFDLFDDEVDEPPRSKASKGRRGHPARKAASSGRGRASIVDEDDMFVDEEEEEDSFDDFGPPARRPSAATGGSARRGAPPKGSRGSSSRGRGGPPPSRGRRAPSGRGGPPSRRGGRSSGAVVPYGNGPPQPGAFTRGFTTFKSYIPDPTSVKDSVVKAASATSSISSSVTKGLYREIKGLTSSELEQVMLKATKPDDTAVKGKHVERLVGVTYQISARYDIYDAVLRKLWKKMVEPDWRTKAKSLYVLHRFSADGASAHGPSLKARLRELRRTKDPKSKEKFFNSKQLLAGGEKSTLEVAKFRAFTARYAHYVLLRAQCFAGMFTEISPAEDVPAPAPKGRKGAPPPKSKGPLGPVTSTALRQEHLEASRLLLKAGSACTLKDGEECENTACCVERVAVDMMGLTAAVATALNKCIKSPKYDSDASIDKDQIKAWCQFYSQELLPQTKALVKKTSPKLDAYGLFLPTRLGASVSLDVLKIGLEGASVAQEVEEEEEEESEEEAPAAAVEEVAPKVVAKPAPAAVKKETPKPKAKPAPEPVEEEEEYEYEEEYYDDEGDL